MANFDRAIPPGGAGKITLQVDTSNLEGKITKNAFVHTNDPNQQKTEITVSAHVRPLFLVKPSRRITLQGVAGDDIRQVRQIRSGDDHPLEITKIVTDLGSAIDHQLTRRKGNSHYELEVRNKASNKVTLKGFLTLFTSHPKKRKLKLPVLIRVKPEVEVIPNRLFINATRSGENIGRQPKRVLTVVNNRGEKFRLVDLLYDKDYFSIRAIPPPGESASKHRLEVLPLLSRIPVVRVGITDTLVIKTDPGYVEELRVPLTIQLKT